jgi:hypothetical protein
MLLERTGFLHGEILALDNFESEEICEPGCRNKIPYQYVQSAFIDRVTSTFYLGPIALPWHLGSIIRDILLFFIPHIHYTIIAFDLLYFTDKATKYLYNDHVSKI